MSAIAAAVVVGSVAGGAIAAKGAKSAAKKAAGAEMSGIEFQRESRDLALEYQKPFREAGYTALNALMDMSGLSRPPAVDEGQIDLSKIPMPTGNQYWGDRSQAEWDAYLRDVQVNPLGTPRFDSGGGKRGFFRPPQVSPADRNLREYIAENTEQYGIKPEAQPFYDWQKNDPGYAFRMQEGQTAVENMLRSAGLLNSGKALRAITRYGQDYGSNEYQQAFGRLGALAGYGGTAVAQGSATIGNAANYIQSGYGRIGEARAGAAIGQANAWGGAISDIGSIYGAWNASRPPPTAPSSFPIEV